MLELIKKYDTVLKVYQALIEAGEISAAQAIRYLEEPAPTAAAAAALIPTQIGAIANSLIFKVNDTPILILTSGAHRVDTDFVARLIAVPLLSRATPEFVKEKTGQAIGGVAPVGHPSPIVTYIDESLAKFPEIWAAAGHPHTVFPISFASLVKITGGTVIPVEKQ